LIPLATKASQILAQGSGYKRQIDRIEELRKRAQALIRGYPNEEGEPHWALFRKTVQLAARAAPPRHPEVMELLKCLRTVLPESETESLERQFDFRFYRTVCKTILRAQEELRYRYGPPPTDSPAPGDAATLVSEAEIDSLEAQIQDLEKQQSEIDLAEPKRFEVEASDALKLLDRIIEKQNTTLAKWAHGQKIARTVIYYWRKGGGHAIAGKISERKSREIEGKIRATAAILGLS
jgi:hypothetical protein